MNAETHSKTLSDATLAECKCLGKILDECCSVLGDPLLDFGDVPRRIQELLAARRRLVLTFPTPPCARCGHTLELTDDLRWACRCWEKDQSSAAPDAPADRPRKKRAAFCDLCNAALVGDHDDFSERVDLMVARADQRLSLEWRINWEESRLGEPSQPVVCRRCAAELLYQTVEGLR